VDSSFGLFSVRGINIRVHITFPLILVWAAIQFGVLTRQGASGAAFGIIVTLLLFAIVVLHELGHSIAAQNYGVPVKQIVLLPIGGVAQLARIPEEPVQELVIAIAGPLVNFGLAILMFAAGLAAGIDGLMSNPLRIAGLLGEISPNAIFTYVFASNLFLGVFNLIPAFPMDGGRVLRALLATRLNYARATRIAVVIGQSMAWLLGLWGFLNGGFFLILIAVFIYMGASQEGQLVQLRNVLGGLKVKQAYSPKARVLNPQSPLREAVDLTLSSFQADFPICDGDQLVGFLTHNQLVDSLNRFGPDVAISQVMSRNITPVGPDDELLAVQQRLSENNRDAAPVVDQDRFLGLITSRDINELYRLVSSQPNLVPALVTRHPEPAKSEKFTGTIQPGTDPEDVPPATLPR
jgi:Zn-dependent protease/CBS domain-containing protein